jgi:DNA topoisomerase-3
MRLVFAEKPDAGRNIAAILGVTRRQDGYMEGDDVVVTWGFGHLVAFDEPEAMNADWGNPWRLDKLPMIPASWTYDVLADKKKQFGVIKKLMADPRVTEIVNAGDADREGERIFRLIYQHAGCRKPVKRAWFSALTEEALRDTLAHLKDGRDYEPLGRAAEARARADWLVGLNATRGYTLRNGSKCTVGRVQTPTLALVVRRQREIEAFKPQPYWSIAVALADAQGAAIPALYVYGDKRDQTRLDDKVRVDQLVDELQRVPEATCTQVDTKEQERLAPHLYDLSTLQTEANAKWGYTAAQVLEAAQALYEDHTAITYPRTSCPCLSTDNVPSFPGILAALAPAYPDAVGRASQRKEPLGKPYVDQVDASHHAIIPTNKPPAQALPEREARIYDLIVKRFLAAFLPPKRTALTTAYFSAADHTLRARGTVLLDPGWTAIYGDLPDDDDDRTKGHEEDHDGHDARQALPPLSHNHTYSRGLVRPLAKTTQPPRPYTDGTLIGAMRTAGAQLEDKDLRAYMSVAGLGTDATRGEIIEKLVRSEYLIRQKKVLVATAKGCALVDQVHPALVDLATTARWEQRLKAIEERTEDPAAFERDIQAYVRELISTVGSVEPIALPPATGLAPCPACKQGTVVESPKAFGCSRWKQGCKFTIWKQLSGKTITAKVASELILNGHTSRKIAGFKSKAGKAFEARLKLTDDYKVTFVFDN